MELAVERSNENARMADRLSGRFDNSSNNGQRNMDVDISQSGSVEQWRPLVSQFTDWNVEEALWTISMESGGNPHAVSDTDDHGLFQLHNGLAEYGEKVYNPWFNVQVAHEMWQQSGWNPWSVWN